MRRALVVRHVVHEGIAGYRAPIEAAGYDVERIPACTTDFASLDVLSPDLLIVMGGPMGVYETADNPWLEPEMQAIRSRIDAGRPILGVCLGSQLIAAALGARVYPGPVPEVGFAPLSRIDPDSALVALNNVPVLHWHQDTFDLPPGARRLASSDLYPNQAFCLGNHILALQFHAEMGEDPRFDTWVEEGGEIMQAAGTDAMTLHRNHTDLGPAAVAAGQSMIETWLAGLARLRG